MLLAPSTINFFFYLFGDKNLCLNTILPTKINCVVKLHCINLLEYTTVIAHLKCSLSQESDGSFLGMLFFFPSSSERGSAVCRGSESTSMYIKSEQISHKQSFMGLSLVQESCQCDFFLLSPWQDGYVALVRWPQATTENLLCHFLLSNFLK